MDQYSSSQIVDVQFKLFSENEAKKLSVLPITNLQTFDPLGHPYDNSLADTSLGPLKRNDFCKTCGLTDQECLGHFGHIQLPLPVFNPFLLKQISQILKMFCFQCHHLLLTSFNLEIYIAQLRSLDLGLDYILDDILQYANEISQSAKGIDWNTYEGKMFLRSKLNEFINRECKKTIQKQKQQINDNNDNVAILESVEIVNSKNVVEKKQHLFKDLFSCKLIKPTRVCFHCNSRKRSFNVINKSLIIMTTGTARKTAHRNFSDSKKSKDAEDEDFDDPKLQMLEMQGKSYLTPSQAREHLRKLWSNEKEILLRLFPFLNIETDNINDTEECPMDVFFWQNIVVPPNRFRPLRHMNGRSFEHYQTAALNELMLVSKSLEFALENAKKKNSGETIARFHHQWQRLQILCNRIYDSQMDNLPDNKAVGVKQILEKKEGLMRKNMMGKRVNFAARSVISPDPYIMADEIGIPVIFATKLSYPQPVTHWNVKRLQEMILNGPNQHPGALSITYEDGYTVRLKPDDLAQRRSIAATIHPPSFNRGLNGVKIVNRHLISGDVLLLNRQPTLHKPSIMAHKARVLPKEKTLRLHYANCKCYNADFDGDEMNAHFPQSELARAEAYNIASVNYQFLVPKDGSPLSGLIQDHIVAGVLMSTRGRFFNKKDYQELIYGALSFLNKPIKYHPPTILKPERLWSGKQIISTLLLNLIPEGKLLPTFEIESKFSAKWLTKEKPREWTAGGSLKEKEMCESQVIFRNGELLCGIMDKVSFGANKNGLIHVCYELYGGDIHSKLLTAIARLCTNFLQTHHGFTLGIHDILVKPKIDSKRKKFIKQSKTIGLNTVLETFAIDLDQEKHDEEFIKKIVSEELQKAHLAQTDKLMKDLDGAYRIQTNKICDQIREACIPKGLVKLFPENNLQMMIQSGAKGGLPNSIQISCLLGQIELEGRRIPLMMSGRTLPSFRPYESEPRAGGFVTGRFLTGIRPQEFFFHCMAGREGLIDTAVKTSRSGYLQRCLIKHLEGLIVNYDLTVRDSEGSVVQWLYGEDGLDILKCQSLKKPFLPIIYNNQSTLKPNKDEVDKLKSIVDPNLSKKITKTRKYLKTIENIDSKSRNKDNSIFLNFEFQQKAINSELTKDDLKKIWLDLDMNSKQMYQKKISKTLDPIIPKYRPDLNIGAISENLDKIIDDYMTKDLKNLSKQSLKDFRQIINIRYMKSLCAPGEAVGLLAAQSIGEPSTQMTLNTFHFAGRGEMNVTLGVPRLRELLMTASSNISTASMRIPFLAEIDDDSNIELEAEKVRLKMNAVRLKDVLEQVHIQEMIEIDSERSYGGRSRIYDIRFEFLPKSYYKHRSFTNPAKILYFMETNFIRKFCESLNRQLRVLTRSYGLFDTKNVSRSVSSRTKKKVIIDGDEEEVFAQDDNADETIENNDENDKNKINKKPLIDDDDDDEDFDDYDVDEGEGDTTAMRQRSRINQEQEYEEPDLDEIEMNDNEDFFNDEQSNDGDNDLIKSIKQELTEDSIEQPVIDQTIITSDISSSKEKSEKTKSLEANLDSRRKRVINNGHGTVIDYNFDCKRELWCEFKLKFPLIAAKLDFKTIIEEEANRAFVHRVGKIDRAFLVEDNDASKRGAKFNKMILTEGVSIPQVVEFERYLDLKRIYSNDMHAIARTYGIEAARAALIREIKDVFGVYGISVDGRHLSLIADHMTFTGTIKGMNRGAMDGISPLQAMTFETTTNFLKNSLLLDLKDDLQSPSSRIVIGRPTVLGTGLFETRLNYKMVADLAQSTLQLNESLFERRSMTATDLDQSTKSSKNDGDGNDIEQKSSFLSPSMLMPLTKKRKRIKTDEDGDGDGEESRIDDSNATNNDNIRIKDEIISDVEDFNDISHQLSTNKKSKKRIKLEFD